MKGEGVRVEFMGDGIPIPVHTDSAHDEGVVAKLSCVISEVSRGSAEFLPGGEHVPEDFAETYYESSVFHNYQNSCFKPSPFISSYFFRFRRKIVPRRPGRLFLGLADWTDIFMAGSASAKLLFSIMGAGMLHSRRTIGLGRGPEKQPSMDTSSSSGLPVTSRIWIAGATYRVQ